MSFDLVHDGGGAGSLVSALILALFWVIPVMLLAIRRQLPADAPARRVLRYVQWLTVLGAAFVSFKWLGVVPS
jgi:hypothetical protein